ncbi:unnamed protein product [Amoebophrya sp. A120]|nr:unnamed protein product [Amoebophrya sp. A120]|eukprot:GSA120T00000868001.1
MLFEQHLFLDAPRGARESKRCGFRMFRSAFRRILLLKRWATRTTRTGSGSAAGTAKTSKRNTKKLHAWSHFFYVLLAPCLLFLFFCCFLFLVDESSSSYFHLPLVQAAFSLEPFFNPLCLPERGGGCDESSATYEISRTNTASETVRSCDTKCRAISGCVAFVIFRLPSITLDCIFYRAGCQIDPTMATTRKRQAGNYDFPYYTLARNEAQCIDQQDTPLLDSDANCPVIRMTSGCGQWQDKRVGLFSDRPYSKEECRYLCAMTDGCADFIVGTGAGSTCDLLSSGCTWWIGPWWRKYSLNQCQLKGRVCPAVWGGACNEFNSLAIAGSDIATVDQTNVANTKITDYDLFCRGRGYDNNCVAMFRNQNNGQAQAMYFVDGCTQSSAAGWQHWSMAQNQAKCKAYVPRVDGTSCPSTFQGACANMNDKQLGSGIYYNDRVYSVAECRYQCANTPNCGGFFTRSNGECWLFQDGCTPSVNPDFVYYRMSDCNLLAEPMVGTLVSVRALSATFSGAAWVTAAQVLLRPEYDFSSRGGSGTNIIASDISVCLNLQRGGLSRQFWAAEFRDGALHYVSGFMIFKRGDNDACKNNFQSYASLEYYDQNGVLLEAPTAVMTSGIVMAADGVWVPVNKWLHKLQIAGPTSGPGLDGSLCWCGIWIYEDLSVTSTTSTTPVPTATAAPPPVTTSTSTTSTFVRRTNSWPRRAPGATPTKVSMENPACNGAAPMVGQGDLSSWRSSEGVNDLGETTPRWYATASQHTTQTGTGLPFYMSPNPTRHGSCWHSAEGDGAPYWFAKFKDSEGGQRAVAIWRLYNYGAAYTSEAGKSGRENRLKKARVYVRNDASEETALGNLDPAHPDRIQSVAHPADASVTAPVNVATLYDPAFRYVDIPLLGRVVREFYVAWDTARVGAPGATEILNVCGIQILEDQADLHPPALAGFDAVARRVPSADNLDTYYDLAHYGVKLFEFASVSNAHELYIDGPPFFDDFRPLLVNGTAAEVVLPAGRVLGLRVFVDWKDQGWGHRKGGLQLEMAASGETFDMAPAPKKRESHIYVVNGCTSHYRFLRYSSGATMNIKHRIGTGNGHVLHILALRIDAIVDNSRRALTAARDRNDL